MLIWIEKPPEPPRICASCKEIMQRRGRARDYLGHSGPCALDTPTEPIAVERTLPPRRSNKRAQRQRERPWAR